VALDDRKVNQARRYWGHPIVALDEKKPERFNSGFEYTKETCLKNMSIHPRVALDGKQTQ